MSFIERAGSRADKSNPIRFHCSIRFARRVLLNPASGKLTRWVKTRSSARTISTTVSDSATSATCWSPPSDASSLSVRGCSRRGARPESLRQKCTLRLNGSTGRTTSMSRSRTAASSRCNHAKVASSPDRLATQSNPSTIRRLPAGPSCPLTCVSSA